MAGLAGLPYFLQYQQQAQEDALRRQYAQIQLADFQQKQQDRQRQQAALEAAGNALPAMFAQQPAQLAPPPQAPNPGQPSVPSQSAAAPGMIQPPPAGGTPPLPPGMPAGMNASTGLTGKPPIPPFRSMPTVGSPAQTAAPQIPAPPTMQAPTQQPSGPLSLDNAIRVLKDQGLSGADLMAGLQQLTPVLDAQAKQQAAQIQQQFQRELQIANLQERYDALRQRASDNALNRADREQAHADSMELRREMLSVHRESLNARLQGDPNAALSGDDSSVDDQVAMARTGMPRTQIIAGYGARATQQWNRIEKGAIDQIMQENPGMSRRDAAAQFASEQQGYKADTGAVQQVTKDIAAFRPYKDMLDKNADIAIELGKKVSMTNSAWANRTLNSLQQNAASNPDLAEYLAQMRFVQTEAARALNNPRLVGGLTDSARHEMQEVVDGNMPLANTERVLRRIQQDGANRLDAMESERNRLLKRPSGNSSPGGTGGKTVNWSDLK